MNISRYGPAILALIPLVLSCKLFAYEEYTFEGYGFYFYMANYKDSTNCHARDGIWRVDLKTGEEKQLFGDNSGRYMIEKCALSYHGKQLVFKGKSVGNGLINNDGTGYTKLPASMPLSPYPPLYPIYWSKQGYYVVHYDKLRRYDIHTGEYEELAFPPLVGGGANGFYGCQPSGDGTRVWTRAGQTMISWGGKNYGPPTSQTYYFLTDDGRPARMFSRNRWGHGETITLDGAHMLFQNFGHNGMWLTRFDDGQHIGDIFYEAFPQFEPDYEAACGALAEGFRRIIRIANSNVWIFKYVHPGKGPDYRDQDLGCYFNTVWNWRTDEHIKIHGPEDGTWLSRCNSETTVQCAGIWKGYDLPSLEEQSACLVPYRENVTFHTARKTTPMERSVRIGNIDDHDLEGISLELDPPDAASWLAAEPVKDNNSSITVTLVLDPTALSEEHQSATVTVNAASARNTASFAVHTNNTMLPRPGNFVVYHANMSDSFAYPEITWDDIAEGEDGYIVEYFTYHMFNTKWEVVDTLPANTTRYISPLTDYIGEYKDGQYRIRAYTNDGLFSPYSEEGGFGVPPDSLVPPPPERIVEPWETGDIPSAAQKGPDFLLPAHRRHPAVSSVDGKLRIEPGNVAGEGYVEVLLPDGRCVAKESFGPFEESTTLALPRLASGIYLVHVADGGGAVQSLWRFVAAR
mgnify:CR=1 FL=1